MSARQRRRRRSAPRRKARRWLRRQDRLTRGLLGAVLLLAIAVVVLFGLLQNVSRPARQTRRSVAPPAASAPPARSARSRPQPPELRPQREFRTTARPVPDRAPAAPHARAAAPATHLRDTLPVHAPRVAIVVDDLGQSFSHFEQLVALGIPLSIAVIPGLPASSRTVDEASRRGIEVLLHQPMEPREEGGKNPGTGVLLTSMSAEAVRTQVRENLAAVHGAVGVNNHMGSRFTEDPAGLAALMAELKERNLFWLDSRTTAATRGLETARASGVPAVDRDVFLDAEVSAAFIRGQLRKLLETARVRGAAVGIGHPHPETIAVLQEMRTELLASGVTLVPVSTLARTGSTAEPGPALAASSARAGLGDTPASGQGTATP